MCTNGRQRYSFGLFICLVGYIAFTLTFAACEKDHRSPVYNNNNTGQLDSSANTISVNYLALGDSYTIGQSVQQSERFPVQLADLLRQKGYPLTQPNIIATTGWTTQNLLDAISAANPSTDNRLVSLLIGVNDQYQHHDTTGYREQFSKCLTKAIQLANSNKNRVFVLSIPDYGVTPFGQNQNPAVISQQIDWFNNVNRDICVSFKVLYIDITPISREALTNQSLTANDGLHPSGLQYKRWVDVIAPKIEELLK